MKPTAVTAAQPAGESLPSPALTSGLDVLRAHWRGNRERQARIVLMVMGKPAWAQRQLEIEADEERARREREPREACA